MKMKKYFVFAALLLLGPLEAFALWGLDSVQSAAGEKIISALTIDLSGIKYYEVPKDVLAPLDLLSKEATNTVLAIPASTLTPLVDFVVSNAFSGKAWELPCSNGVFGAMAIGVLTNSFEERAAFCLPDFPDHAVFSTLRYSEELTSKNGEIVKNIFSAPEGTLNRDHSLNFDIISPNETSGAYYSYTNTRIYVQGKVNDRRVMVTGTLMHAPSSISCKGALIDPKYPGLYFYSTEKGLTLPGGGWMETTMDYYRSFTISIEMSSNVYAFATMSWLSAGWKGINVLRTHHIYEVLSEIIKELQTYGGPQGLSLAKIRECVEAGEKMSDAEVDERYKKYCDFCHKIGDTSMLSVNMDAFKRIYSKKDLENLPRKLRRALVVQEMMREAKGCPSWSKAE